MFNQKKFLTVVDVLKKTAVDKLPNDLEGMEVSMEKLLALIDDVYKYVDDVVVRKLVLFPLIDVPILYMQLFPDYVSNFDFRKGVLHQIITLEDLFQIP